MTDTGDVSARPPGDVPKSRRDAAQSQRAAASPGPSEVPPLPDSSADFQAHVRAARSEFESQVAHARDQFEEANEKIKQRTGRDLIVATLIGLAAGLAVVATLIFLKWIFVIFAVAATVIGIFEFGRALQVGGRRIDLIPHAVLGSLLVGCAYFIDLWALWVMLYVAIAVVIVWRAIGQMVAKDGRTYGDVLRDILTGVFLQLYVPFLASACVVLLRQDQGEWWVLAFIIVVVACDVGAYATGLAFGKHPMAPKISPKKTWEGFAGAATAALIAGVLLALYMLHLPWWAGLIFGAVLLVTATAGDLSESMLKRDLGIKDMSSWLPGHGGVLDRLDSILLSGVTALALYYLLSPLAVA